MKASMLFLSLAILIASATAEEKPAYAGKDKPVSKYNPSTKFYEPVRCGKPGAPNPWTCYRLNIQMLPTATNVTGGIFTTLIGTLVDVPTKATVGEWSGINIKTAGDGSSRIVVNVLEFGPERDDALQVDGGNEKTPDGSNRDRDRIVLGGSGRFRGAVGDFDYTGSILGPSATIFANISLWVPQLPEIY